MHAHDAETQRSTIATYLRVRPTPMRFAQHVILNEENHTAEFNVPRDNASGCAAVGDPVAPRLTPPPEWLDCTSLALAGTSTTRGRCTYFSSMASCDRTSTRKRCGSGHAVLLKPICHLSCSQNRKCSRILSCINVCSGLTRFCAI